MPDLDDYHAHEALDRTSLIAELIGSALIEHPFIDQHKELLAKVEAAQALLLQVYQDIGARHL